MSDPDASSVLVKGATVTLFLLFAACAPKHPDLSLRRQAAKANRELEDTTPAASGDDRYAVPRADAVAATANALQATAPLAEVSDETVSTDWIWSGSTAVDAASEYYDQRRVRTVVTLEPLGAEFAVHGASVSGTRRARPGRVDDWGDGSAPVEVAGLAAALGDLEAYHLRHLRAGPREAVLDAFVATLPSGFEVVERSRTVLRAEVTNTTGKAGAKGASASWDARESLEARIGQNGAVTVTYLKDDRFTVGATVGDWIAANPSDAPAVDWALAALRQGFVAGDLVFGEAHLAPVAPRPLVLSEPPPLPKVRTIDEVKAVVTARAIEQGVGRFEVCVDVILVNPASPEGTNWDLPGMETALDIVTGASQVAATTLAEVNRVGDLFPPVGAVVDTTLASASGGLVERHTAERVSKITSAVAGYANANLGYAPDVVGTYTVGDTVLRLTPTHDQLTSAQGLCSTTDFRRRGPLVGVEVWDDDLDQPDFVGSCSYTLDDVLRRGGSGIACGYARVFPSARFLFDLDQIAVVGLPPPEVGSH